MLPYIPFSVERRKECTAILLAGNQVLHRLYKASNYKNKTDFRVALFREMDAGTAALSVDDAQAIQAVRDIEYEVLCGLCRMIYKLGAKWAKKMDINGLNDYQQDALLAAMKAIYCYRKPNIQLTTYVEVTIKRELYKVFDPRRQCLTKRDRKLRAKLEVIIKEANGPINLEEAMLQMDLTTEQRLALWATFIVVNEEDASQNLTVNNLQDYRCGGEEHPMTECLSHISDLSLSEFEQEVLHHAATSERGWQTEVCRRHNYTRRAAGAALLRIRDKLLKHLKRSA